MANNPISPAMVNPMLHKIIPMLIHKSRRSFSAPSAMPTAAPSGAPKSRGDNNPKPTGPYLFQILYNLLFLRDFSSPYFHFRSLFLKLSPNMVTKAADSIAPAADTVAISIGLTFITNPKGIASHNSTTLATKIMKIDSRLMMSRIWSFNHINHVKKEDWWRINLLKFGNLFYPSFCSVSVPRWQ